MHPSLIPRIYSLCLSHHLHEKNPKPSSARYTRTTKNHSLKKNQKINLNPLLESRTKSTLQLKIRSSQEGQFFNFCGRASFGLINIEALLSEGLNWKSESEPTDEMLSSRGGIHCLVSRAVRIPPRATRQPPSPSSSLSIKRQDRGSSGSWSLSFSRFSASARSASNAGTMGKEEIAPAADDNMDAVQRRLMFEDE